MKKNLAVKLLAPAALLCLAAGGLVVAPTDDVSAVTAVAGSFEMLATHEVRMDDENTGLRFTARISESYYTANQDKNFGMVIFPASRFDEITSMNGENVEYLDVLDDEGQGKYVKIYNDPAQVDGSGDYYLKGAIANIYYDNYNLDFVAIGFVETVEGDTVSYEYATFDKDAVSANIYETAVKSLKVAGYENNAILQNFVTKGILQKNGVSKEDAETVSYSELGEYLGLSVSTTADHIAVGGETSYTVSSANDVDFDSLGVEVTTDNGTIADGKLTGASEGLATISVKFAGVTLDETTVYVGNEALALYSNDYNYNNERNNRSMQCGVHSANPGNAWGLAQSNIATRGVVDMTDASEETVATAYQTAFGEALSSAYKISLNITPVNKTWRLMETRIPLTDAAYVFGNYKSVTVRALFTNFGTTSTTVPYWGMFVTKDGTGDANLASVRTTDTVATGTWVEYTFPLELTDAYVDGSTYRLTLGMDIVEEWGTADIYIADIEFNTSYNMTNAFASKITNNSLNVSWITGETQLGSWGKGGSFSQKGATTALPSDLVASYKTAFGEKPSANAITASPNFAQFQLSNGQWIACQNFSTSIVDGTPWYSCFEASTKVKVRAYVATSTAMTVQAGVYTFGGSTNPLRRVDGVVYDEIERQTVTTGSWQEFTFDIPLYWTDATNFTIGFNFADNFGMSDITSQTATIYVSDLWFE
ncbi:MAG: hypothetical protein IJA89_02385 [Clostridia bacterium]|nr:hypothetical protein [Clostridia bacterium]